MSDWGLMQAVQGYNKSMAQPSQWQQKPQLPAPSGPGQSYTPDSGMLPAWAVGHAGGGFNDNMGGWGPSHGLPAPSGPGKSYTPGTGFLGGGNNMIWRPGMGGPGDQPGALDRWQNPKPPVWDQPQDTRWRGGADTRPPWAPPTQGGLPFDAPGWEKPMPQPYPPQNDPYSGVSQDDWYRKFGQLPPPDQQLYHTMPAQPYNPPPSNGGIVVNPSVPNLGQAGLDAVQPFLDTFRKPMQPPATQTQAGPAISPAQRAPLDQNMDGIDDRIFQSQQRQTQLDAQLKMKQLEAKREQAQLMQTRKRMEQQRRQQEQLAKQAQMAQPIGQFGNSWNQFQDMRRKFVGQTTPMFNSPLAGNGSFARSYGTPEGSLPRNTAPYLME